MKNRHRYPPNWEDTIRPKVLERDGYECQKCKVKHRSIDKSGLKRVILQVSHKDHTTRSHSLGNLWLLCPPCHLEYDRAVNNILRKSKLRHG